MYMCVFECPPQTCVSVWLCCMCCSLSLSGVSPLVSQGVSSGSVCCSSSPWQPSSEGSLGLILKNKIQKVNELQDYGSCCLHRYCCHCSQRLPVRILLVLVVNFIFFYQEPETPLTFTQLYTNIFRHLWCHVSLKLETHKLLKFLFCLGGDGHRTAAPLNT